VVLLENAARVVLLEKLATVAHRLLMENTALVLHRLAVALAAVAAPETKQGQTKHNSEALLVVAYSPALVDEVLLLEDLVALVALLGMRVLMAPEVMATLVAAAAGVQQAAQAAVTLAALVVQLSVALVTL
jgi:hypothetical protein